MKHRLLLIVALTALLLGGLFVAPAQALKVSGGTEAQRADVYATVAAMQFPSLAWVEDRVGSINIVILDHYDPYWMASLGGSDEIVVDIFSAAAAGVAWPGEIRAASSYSPGQSSFWREIISHEMSHQVWFALLHVPGASTEWRQRVEEGLTPDPDDWFQNYVESHAEQLRIVAWSPLYYLTTYPRTHLNILGDEAVRDFHARWAGDNPPPPTTSTTRTTLPPTTTTTRYAPPVSTTTTTVPPTTTSTTAPPPATTTTTVPRADPFLDVTRADQELWDASWWGRDAGIWLGYPNGHLEGYLLLSHRHAALLADRWVGVAISGWIADYSPVTRGELRDALPGLAWDSERWDEYLLRSQLLRLMWRNGE